MYNRTAQTLELSPSEGTRRSPWKEEDEEEEKHGPLRNQGIRRRLAGNQDDDDDFYESRRSRKDDSRQLEERRQGIEREIERASSRQEERIGYELESNNFYRREINELRTGIEKLKSKDNKQKRAQLEEFDKSISEWERNQIKRIQTEREMDLTLSNTQSPSQIGGPHLDTVEREIIRKQQQRREEEMLRYLSKKADDKAREGQENLQESQSTNTLTKSGSSMKNLGRSFIALEEKMNRLEKQLDSQIKQSDEDDEGGYTRNKDLIRGRLGRQSPKKEEADDKYEEPTDEEEEEEGEEEEIDEEEEEVIDEEEGEEEGYKSSSRKKKGRSVGFQDAFKKKEAQIRQENDRIELNRREFQQHTSESPGDPNYETFGTSAKNKKDIVEGVYEHEIEKLKEENKRIKQELNILRSDKPKDPDVPMNEEDYEQYLPEREGTKSQKFPTIKAQKSSRKMTAEIESRLQGPSLRSQKVDDKKFEEPKEEPKKRAVVPSDPNYTRLAGNAEISQTVKRARKQVQTDLQQNAKKAAPKYHPKKTSSAQKENYPQINSKLKDGKPLNQAVRQDLQEKYYGHRTYCPERALLLHLGIPTTNASDNSRQSDTLPDPKHSIPKRLEKYL